jgi:predicted Zn-dependent protease
LNGLATKEGQVLDQTLFGPKATLLSDPRYAPAPGSVHQSGLPLTATTWIEKGVLKTLPVSRFWAQEKKIAPQPVPSNLIFPGEGMSLEELIGMVENGVLVTRLWYLRMVQPKTLLYTGLTRDGTFAIRDGKIAGPINNFRFNESPVTVLKNLVATGVPERVLGSEVRMPMHVPPMVVRDFNLSSVSDAS